MSWPFRRTTRATLSWWKSDYSELADFNALRMRAKGVMYTSTASRAERTWEMNEAQSLLEALSPAYLARMAEVQADYDVTMRGANGAATRVATSRDASTPNGTEQAE
jgi:hypothetical protein